MASMTHQNAELFPFLDAQMAQFLWVLPSPDPEHIPSQLSSFVASPELTAGQRALRLRDVLFSVFPEPTIHGFWVDAISNLVQLEYGPFDRSQVYRFDNGMEFPNLEPIPDDIYEFLVDPCDTSEEQLLRFRYLLTTAFPSALRRHDMTENIIMACLVMKDLIEEEYGWISDDVPLNQIKLPEERHLVPENLRPALWNGNQGYTIRRKKKRRRLSTPKEYRTANDIPRFFTSVSTPEISAALENLHLISTPASTLTSLTDPDPHCYQPAGAATATSWSTWASPCVDFPARAISGSFIYPTTDPWSSSTSSASDNARSSVLGKRNTASRPIIREEVRRRRPHWMSRAFEDADGDIVLDA